MDWSKAKSLIILIFLALNVYLSINIISRSSIGDNISAEASASAAVILKNRGILLETEIPLYDKKTPKLICEIAHLDKKGLVLKLLGESMEEAALEKEEIQRGEKTLKFSVDGSFTFTGPGIGGYVNINDKVKTEKQLRSFLSELGFDMPSYLLDEYSKKEKDILRFTFTYRYKDFLVFDHYIKGDVSSAGITFLEGKVKNVKGLSQQKLEIIPVYKILLNEYVQGDSLTITDISLGFKSTMKTESDMAETQEGPVWRVVARDRKPEYFWAENGIKID